MAEHKHALRARAAGLAVAIALVGAGAAGVWQQVHSFGRTDYQQLPRAPVRRSDLYASVNVFGRLDTMKKTLIECELENLSVATNGRSLSAGGASTILRLIPDGSYVQQGDVLCELDAAEYVELVRQQTIKLEEERAELEAALLSLKTAETALQEFTEGLLQQSRQQYAGEIALSKADLEAQRERLDWTETMVGMGYIAPSRGTSERIAFDRARLLLDLGEKARAIYEKYGIPRTIRTLESRIEAARVAVAYEQLSVQRHEERLRLLQQQVDRCTIRAPHDGFVIYATDDDDDERIEVGARVRQKQDLFFLPDLTQLEVWTHLPESVVNRVQPGLPARIRVESFRDLEIEGHVLSVAPLAIPNRSYRTSPDVKSYLGRVQLHSVPSGLRPGMTAEVAILTEQRPQVLVVPPQAVLVAGGRDYCVVAGPNGPEPREVAIGTGTPEALEIRAGLQEGEQVFLDPDRLGIDFDPIQVADTVEEPSFASPGLAEPAG